MPIALCLGFIGKTRSSYSVLTPRSPASSQMPARQAEEVLMNAPGLPASDSIMQRCALIHFGSEAIDGDKAASDVEEKRQWRPD